MIKKIGGKYVVLSETAKRRFGSYKTKKEALKRLRQVEFFSASTSGRFSSGEKGGSAFGGKHLKKRRIK